MRPWSVVRRPWSKPTNGDILDHSRVVFLSLTLDDGQRTSSMKYAIIVPDGCADEPQAALGGKTPLQAARTPNMDRIAHLGVVGRSDNVPSTLTPASDVATL